MRIAAVAIQMLLLGLPLRAADGLAADPFAAFVGGAALQNLRAGATMKASLPDDGTLALVPDVTSRSVISDDVKKLGPTVGAELLKIIPGPGVALDSPAGQLLLYNQMHDVSTMKGITYWSVTRGREMVLFLDSSAISSPAGQDRVQDPTFTEIPGSQEMFTFQEDSSFGKNTYSERFIAQPDHLLVKTENLSTITFLLVPIISPHGLVSQVVLVPAGTDVLFYGLAYLRTGFPLGDKASRVQSLENRLSALAGWLAKRLAAAEAPLRSP
jgi:hypothetical protein